MKTKTIYLKNGSLFTEFGNKFYLSECDGTVSYGEDEEIPIYLLPDGKLHPSMYSDETGWGYFDTAEKAIAFAESLGYKVVDLRREERV